MTFTELVAALSKEVGGEIEIGAYGYIVLPL